MEILCGRRGGGDSVLFAIYSGGDSVLVNKKEWGGGGFCPGGFCPTLINNTLTEVVLSDIKS